MYNIIYVVSVFILYWILHHGIVKGTCLHEVTYYIVHVQQVKTNVLCRVYVLLQQVKTNVVCRVYVLLQQVKTSVVYHVHVLYNRWRPM